MFLQYGIINQPVLQTASAPDSKSSQCACPTAKRWHGIVQRVVSLKIIDRFSCNSQSSYPAVNKDRLIKSELSLLERRRVVADLILFYKIVNRLIVIDLGDLIQPINCQQTRGHSRRFTIPPARINCRLHFFVNKVIPIWNPLSEVSVTASSVYIFRKYLANESFQKFLIQGF